MFYDCQLTPAPLYFVGKGLCEKWTQVCLTIKCLRI